MLAYEVQVRKYTAWKTVLNTMDKEKAENQFRLEVEAKSNRAKDVRLIGILATRIYA